MVTDINIKLPKVPTKSSINKTIRKLANNTRKLNNVFSFTAFSQSLICSTVYPLQLTSVDNFQQYHCISNNEFIFHTNVIFFPSCIISYLFQSVREWVTECTNECDKIRNERIRTLLWLSKGEVGWKMKSHNNVNLLLLLLDF